MTIYADGNVAFDPAGHMQLITLEPVWLIQKSAASTNFTGVAPQAVLNVPAPIVVGPGKASAINLIRGGLFTFQSIGKALVVESNYEKNASFTYVINTVMGTTRTMPLDKAFILGAGETITVTCTGATGAGAEVGFLVRLQGDRGI